MTSSQPFGPPLVMVMDASNGWRVDDTNSRHIAPMPASFVNVDEIFKKVLLQENYTTGKVAFEQESERKYKLKECRRHLLV